MSIADDAARIALFVLQAITNPSPREEVRTHFVNAGPNALDVESALQALVALPKPVNCTAALKVAALGIHCAQLTEPGHASGHAEMGDRRVRFWRRVILGSEMIDPEKIVLCFRAGRLKLVATMSAWENFLRSYDIQHSASLGEPDKECTAMGASRVIAIGPPGDARVQELE